jgi:hypothetical protein
LPDATVILGPQYVSYKFGTGSAATTVSELAIPFAVIVPFGERFGFDISTAYANAAVKSAGATTSSISGLTDTQLRGNYTFGDNAAVITLGVNLPTGQYTVPATQQAAAGQIGSDFLVYPVPSMGNGLGATGGVAFAQTLGDWNLGYGGSFRHSTPFDAYQVASSVLRFTPGDEYRLRVGLDRPVSDGRFSVAVTYSKFTNDAADSTTFATGDRALGQASIYLPNSSGTSDVQLSAWNLYRGAGQLIGAPAPWTNVSNLNFAVGWTVSGVYIQPSVEGRYWTVGSAGAVASTGTGTGTSGGGGKAGTMANLGLRLRYDVGALSLNPSATYTVGTLYAYQAGGGPSTDLTGFKAMLLVRFR